MVVDRGTVHLEEHHGIPTPGGEQEGEETIQVDLRLPVQALGFQAPPVPVHLKLLQLSKVVRVLAWTPTSDETALKEWLLQNDRFESAAHVAMGRGLLTLTFPELPEGWRSWTQGLDIRHVHIRSNGEATMTVRGPRSKLPPLLEALGLESRAVQNVSGEPEEEAAPELLTTRQADLLALAASEGYYEVPRKITLKDLAEKVGSSTGALSGTLRRAEARLVRAFLQQPDEGYRLFAGEGTADEEAVPEATGGVTGSEAP